MKKGNVGKEKDNKKAGKKTSIQNTKKELVTNLIKKIDKNKKQRTHPNRVINPNKKPLAPPEFPEAIVDSILNKIISYVIYQTTVKEVYTHMDEKCFNYLKYLITPILSTEYLYYENGVENINLLKDKFYYKAPIPKKVNTWVFLQEPETPRIDRYSSSVTKIISCKTDNDINKENINIDINKQESKDFKKRRKSTVIDDNLIVNESIEYTKRNRSSKLTSLRNDSYQENNKVKNIKNNKDNKDITSNEILDKKKLKLLEKKKKEEEQKILELTWVDLPKEKYENKYIMKNNNEENNILRKERENLIIKQTELKALKEIQDKKEKLKKFQNRLQRNFDGSRQTFDPNGNIINIHPPQVENLNNEFCIVKIPNIESKNPNLEKRRSSAIITKNQLLMKRKSILGKSKILKKVSSLKNKEEHISEENKEIFNYIKNNLLPKWQHRPVKKEFYEDDDDNGEEKKERNFFANKPFKQYFGSFLKEYIFKDEVEHNPVDRINNNQGYYKYESAKKKMILPSGPNFKKIKPETGVVIENNTNEKKKEIKDGGFEFIKKYNKPSMYEFSKLLMETSQLNSSKVLSSGLIESKLNEINELKNIDRNAEKNKEEYNYNGYMMEFSDNNNPLIQGAFSINDKKRMLFDKENYFDKINILKGRNILKSMDEKYIKNKYNSMNYINMQNNSIQLTNNVKAPNLYSYFHESMKEPEKKLESNDEEEDNNKDKNIDFNKDFYTLDKERNKERNSALPAIRVRKKQIDRYNLNELRNQLKGRKIINKFNYKIIKNKKWGEEDEKKKKEREMLNFGLDSRNASSSNIQNNQNNNNNDSNRVKLKKVGENIMSSMDDRYNIRSRRAHLFRSSSAGNIF